MPAGGGKPYLAVSALSRLFGRYLGRNTGFVLWIVPNEAIYTKPRKQLANRQHPYRQMLDVSNILVEVRGTDLDREVTIKMPLNLDPHEGTGWRNTLRREKIYPDFIFTGKKVRQTGGAMLP